MEEIEDKQRMIEEKLNLFTEEEARKMIFLNFPSEKEMLSQIINPNTSDDTFIENELESYIHQVISQKIYTIEDLRKIIFYLHREVFP